MEGVDKMSTSKFVNERAKLKNPPKSVTAVVYEGPKMWDSHVPNL